MMTTIVLKRSLLALSIVTLLALLVVGVNGHPPPIKSVETIENRSVTPKAEASFLFLAPDGEDESGDGSIGKPFRTLERAHNELEKTHASGDIHIRVAAGTYHCSGAGHSWNYWPTNLRLYIEAADDFPSLLDTEGDRNESRYNPHRPVFLGTGEDGKRCNPAWLNLAYTHPGGELIIQGFRITHYKTAIAIRGKRGAPKGKQRVMIRNMVFEEIGDQYYPASKKFPGKAAILLAHSDNNEISNNLFLSIRNGDGDKKGSPGEDTRGKIHGIYMAKRTSKNLVVENTFIDITGSAIKVSNGSNDNHFFGNHFDSVRGVFRDRWCGAYGRETAEYCGDRSGCASWGNVFPLVDTRAGAKNTFVRILPPINTDSSVWSIEVRAVRNPENCKNESAHKDFRLDLGDRKIRTEKPKHKCKGCAAGGDFYLRVPNY